MTIRLAPASASTEAGGPGYQMSSQIVSPTRAPATSISAGRVARLEVAALVEDAVVRQQDLAVDGADLPVPEHGDGVVGGRVVLGEADQRHDPSDPGGELVDAPRRAASRKCGFSHRSSAG